MELSRCASLPPHRLDELEDHLRAARVEAVVVERVGNQRAEAGKARRLHRDRVGHEHVLFVHPGGCGNPVRRRRVVCRESPVSRGYVVRRRSLARGSKPARCGSPAPGRSPVPTISPAICASCRLWLAKSCKIQPLHSNIGFQVACVARLKPALSGSLFALTK